MLWRWPAKRISNSWHWSVVLELLSWIPNIWNPLPSCLLPIYAIRPKGDPFLPTPPQPQPQPHSLPTSLAPNLFACRQEYVQIYCVHIQQISSCLLLPQAFLRCLHLAQSSVMRWSNLCYTVAGHSCDLLTITDFEAPPQALDAREYIVLTSRVHPGETSASWVMQVSWLLKQNLSLCTPKFTHSSSHCTRPIKGKTHRGVMWTAYWNLHHVGWYQHKPTKPVKYPWRFL